MQHLRWTEEENDLLRTHFPKEGLTVASRFPQRSPSAIASHAYKTLRLKIAKNEIRPWSKEELKVLKDFFHVEGKKVSARLPGRNQSVCYQKAKELGLTSTVKKPWTKDEIYIMETFYNKESIYQLLDRLPDRGEQSIRRQACRMGLSMPPSAWSEKEDIILKEFYPKEAEAVSKRLPGRTGMACRARYYKIAPEIKRRPWTVAEDKLLIDAHISNNIGNLSSILPDRTIAACQQRLRYLMGAATTHPS